MGEDRRDGGRFTKGNRWRVPPGNRLQSEGPQPVDLSDLVEAAKGMSRERLLARLVSIDKRISLLERKIVDTDAARVPKLAQKLHRRLDNLLDERAVVAEALKSITPIEPPKPRSSRDLLVEAVDLAHKLIDSDDIAAFLQATDEMCRAQENVVREFGIYGIFPSFPDLQRAMDVRFHRHRVTTKTAKQGEQR